MSPSHPPTMARRAIAFALVALACAAAVASRAAAADTSTVTYSLNTPPSAYEYGCFGSCECPVVTTPTYGSFELVQTGRDPLYDYYEVRNYIASFNDGPGAVAITGSGTYRIGGEVAVTQELTLDLSIEGRPTQHFESGLVAGPSAFPRLDLACSAHGLACLDTVVVVNAAPIAVAAVPEAPHADVAFEPARPNPFAGQARIALTLARPARVSLAILDLQGRQVRALASGQLCGPGEQAWTWDGRRDDGRAAPAGVYWVSLRWPGGTDRQRVVKIR